MLAVQYWRLLRAHAHGHVAAAAGARQLRAGVRHSKAGTSSLRRRAARRASVVMSEVQAS